MSKASKRKDSRKLSPVQAKVYDFINEYWIAHGRPPTSEEIKVKFGWKSRTASLDCLGRLERKGWIERGEGFRNICTTFMRVVIDGAARDYERVSDDAE